ncbi:MAG: hypothetical protein LUB83_00080 [Prevotellaceae bacterium]|nr:hypothetical protein [Prevotellaceae bacterium]
MERKEIIYTAAERLAYSKRRDEIMNELWLKVKECCKSKHFIACNECYKRTECDLFNQHQISNRKAAACRQLAVIWMYRNYDVLLKACFKEAGVDFEGLVNDYRKTVSNEDRISF